MAGPQLIPRLLSVSVTWPWWRGTGSAQIPWALWSHLGIHEGPEQGVLLAHICKSLAGDFPDWGHTGTRPLRKPGHAASPAGLGLVLGTDTHYDSAFGPVGS